MYQQHFERAGAAWKRRHHHHHPFAMSHFRAPVNVYKTENSYELLVFAPGRVKENFKVSIADNKLAISYEPAQDLPRPKWISREYSRGAFERSFVIDDTVDTTNINASYNDGVLQVSLPIIPGKETAKQEIVIN